MDELSAKDTTDARSKQMELLKEGYDNVASRFIYYYSWFWAVSSTIYFFMVSFVPLPPGGQHFADVILGFLLGTAVATIIGFFYGNSKQG